MINIRLVQGDITKIPVDAIVNAANASLMGGGGVDGAIHLWGGPSIKEACVKIREEQGDCQTGQAVITTAGHLPAKFVIHTVGPMWNGNDEEEHKAQLANCYRSSLSLAIDNDANSISFPNISTGVYGFPKRLAAQIAVQTVRDFLSNEPSGIEVIFVCYDTTNHDLYRSLVGN